MARTIVVLALLVVAAASGSVDADGQRSRIIDRTVACETGLSGGIREIEITASSAYKPGTGHVSVDSGVFLSGTLAGVGQTQLYLSPACRPMRTPIALTSRGLVGGVAGKLPESVDCATPRRVLLRVRGVFRSPVVLKRGRRPRPPLLYAIGKVQDGAIAVRTLSGKPLAFAKLTGAGQVRVFAAIPESCIPD
jgi:hypothetical protein